MKPLMLIRGVVLCGALTLVCAATALAAAAPASRVRPTSTPYYSAENTPLPAASGSSGAHASAGAGAGILRTLLGLAVVILLIWGIAWILRRVKGGGARASGSGLDHIATLPLGNGRSVALVRAGQEFVLVGISEHAVTPIRTYSEAEAIAAGFELGGQAGEGELLEAGRTPAGRLLDALRRMTVRS